MSEGLECLLERAELAQCRTKIGELESKIKSIELRNNALQTRFEREQDENKNLRLTLALRIECEQELARNKNPEIEDLEIKLAIAEKEILVMESTNKELMATLNTTRAQLGKMLRERNQKVKEVEQLEEALDRLERNGRSRSEDLSYESANYASNMQVLLDELNHQATRWASEKTSMKIDWEKKEKDMKNEIERLQKQKEDIVNHLKNSEKMWSERLSELNVGIHTVRHAAASPKSESVEMAEMEAEIRELHRKLKDALDAIGELDDNNTELTQALDKANAQLIGLENQILLQGTPEDLIKEIERLENEKKMLEELRAREQIESAEKATQQTITFSNEKAKFCHEVERIEEKWNTEVVKLKEHNDSMGRMLFASTKDIMERRQEHEEEIQNLKDRIEELQGLLHVQKQMADRQLEQYNTETAALKDQLKEIKSVQENSVKEWDDECADLEDEIYELIDKRKTEAKKMRTLSKKNVWLTKSIRKLSEQRRAEIESKDEQIKKLHSQAELHKIEKVEWLNDLKKEVNAWKAETSNRVELEKQMEELKQFNEGLQTQVYGYSKEVNHLEGTIRNMNRTCREQQQIIHENTKIMNLDLTSWKEKAQNEAKKVKCIQEESALKIKILEEEKKELEKMIKAQKAEANDLQKATVELSKMELDNLRTVLEMEKTEAVNEKAVVIKAMEKKLKALNETSTNDKCKLADAKETIDHWKSEVRSLGESRAVDRLLWQHEVDQLKETNEKLKENLGVEALDDVVDSGSSSEEESDSEDSDSSSDDEMDTCDDVKVEKKPVAEWELVDEDE